MRGIPEVSIVIECYNETMAGLAPHTATIAGLLQQDYPLENVEVILLGTSEQAAQWTGRPPEWNAFHSVRALAVPDHRRHYNDMKLLGAQAASAGRIAFLDADVNPLPTWLGALMRGLDEAEVSVGPSLFQRDGEPAHEPLNVAAASISWGFILGRDRSPQALLLHNAGVRREAFERAVPERLPELSFSSIVLWRCLRDAGLTAVFSPRQQVAHGMTWKWWLLTRHFRSGWETYERYRHGWPRNPVLARVPFLEPMVSKGRVFLHDLPAWFRFSNVVGYPAWKTAAVFPLVFPLALAARTMEAVGMYCAWLIPERTREMARF